MTKPLAISRSDAGARPSVRRVFIGLFWTALVLVVIRFWFKDALPFFTFTDAVYGRFWGRAGWLLVHVVAGSVALLMGPFQFWTGLRRTHLQFHRWTGRLYLTGVAVGAASAFYLAFKTEVGWTFGTALFMLAVAWVFTSAMALLAIRRRQIAVHRDWMARSYIVTFAFVTFRILFETPAVLALGTRPEVASTAMWMSWTVPLFVFEFVRQIRK